MKMPGSGSTVSPEFIETLTCYHAWVGGVSYTSSLGPYVVNTWSISLLRQPDWLSSQLRATRVGTQYASVKICTPSGDVLTLMNAMFAGYGAAWWADPTHPKPSVPLERVSYNCSVVLVDNTRILSRSYNWWQLNA